MRTDTEILKGLIDAVMEYNSLRDDEWEFQDEHGHPDFWDAEVCDEHDELVADVLESRQRVRALLVEATGDDTISF